MGIFHKTTHRFFFKNISYVIFSTLCLGLALAVGIVAYINYSFYDDYDNNYQFSDRIYRIEHTRMVADEVGYFSESPYTLGALLKEPIQEIQKIVRVNLATQNLVIDVSNTLKSINVVYADPEFFNVFTFPLIAGDINNFIDQSSIYITTNLAETLFGGTTGIGHTVNFVTDNGSEKSFIVQGVMENLPLNSSFHFDAVMPFANSREQYIFFDEYDWRSWVTATFVLIDHQKNKDKVEAKLQKYGQDMMELFKDFNQVKFYLMPMTEISHQRALYQHEWYSFKASPPVVSVVAPLLAAATILIFACFNFINMFMAFSRKRIREIGIRKVLGSPRGALILQFMGETFILVFLSICLAILLSIYLVPAYSSMWPFLELKIDISHSLDFWLFCIAVLILLTIITGSYPALLLSGYKPAQILKGQLSPGSKNRFVDIMMMVQIGITTGILMTGIVLNRNAVFLETLDPGFDTQNVFYFEPKNPDNTKALLNAVKDHHLVENTCSYFDIFNFDSIVYHQKRIGVSWFKIGPNCIETAGFRLVEGRSFRSYMGSSDVYHSIIVNEDFVERLDIADPVGETVWMGDTLPLQIVGVVKDFYFNGPWEEIVPIFFKLTDRSDYSIFIVRLAPGSQEEVISYLRQAWNDNTITADYDFQLTNLKDDINRDATDINQNILTITRYFVVVTIILSFIGLYVQITLNIMHKSKEIAVRRIFGSSVSRIIWYIGRKYIVILATGSFLGLAGGGLFIGLLLRSIWAYFTDIPLYLYLIPFLLVLILSFPLLILNIHHNMVRKPSEILRYE